MMVIAGLHGSSELGEHGFSQLLLHGKQTTGQLVSGLTCPRLLTERVPLFHLAGIRMGLEEPLHPIAVVLKAQSLQGNTALAGVLLQDGCRKLKVFEK